MDLYYCIESLQRARLEVEARSVPTGNEGMSDELLQALIPTLSVAAALVGVRWLRAPAKAGGLPVVVGTALSTVALVSSTTVLPTIDPTPPTCMVLKQWERPRRRYKVLKLRTPPKPRRRNRRATHDGNFMQSPLMLRVLARREVDQLIRDAIDREASFWTQMHGAFSAAASAAAAVACKVVAASQLESELGQEASVVMVEVAQLEGVAEEEEVTPSDTPEDHYSGASTPMTFSGASTPMVHHNSEPVTPYERVDAVQRLRRRTVSFMHSGRERETLGRVHARRVQHRWLEVTTGSILLSASVSPEALCRATPGRAEGGEGDEVSSPLSSSPGLRRWRQIGRGMRRAHSFGGGGGGGSSSSSVSQDSEDGGVSPRGERSPARRWRTAARRLSMGSLRQSLSFDRRRARASARRKHFAPHEREISESFKKVAVTNSVERQTEQFWQTQPAKFQLDV